jgi:5-methyltetrahydrofolate--homocysteine methyltransferase
MGNERIKSLCAALDERILVLDGAMGTMIQQRDLTAADFGGAALEGCNENLVLTRPDVIRDIHRQYFAAGANIVETDTFGATPLVLAEYGLADKAREINRVAARIAREAAAEFNGFVAGSIGPTTKAITVTGGVTFTDLIQHFHEQALGLIEGGADLLLVETCQDTRNIKAALIAIAQTGVKIPVMVSGTIEPMGTMLAGQAADALVASLQHVELLAIGLNCATGPEFMTDHIRTIHQMANTHVSCFPNAERRRLVPRNANHACVVTRTFREERLAQYRWRLLRHNAGPYQGHCRDGRRQRTAPAPWAAEILVYRHRIGRGDRRQPAADRRRTHERSRVAGV